MHHSVSKNQQVRKYDHLHKDIEADVCIIGGGITGISTALNLRNSGLKVVLLEAMQMGSGTTGFSSNHLNTQIDFSYQEVIKIHSLDKARMVSQSRAWAINSIEDTIKELNISCGFERIDGYLYAENAENAEFIQKEAEACQKAGVASSLTDQLPLPINQHKTLLFPDQAVFNSWQYIHGIASHRQESCQIFEQSRVTGLDRQFNKVFTESGTVTAEHIVLATHLPLFINLHQTTAAPYRSYMITAKLREYPPQGLYWDNMEPYHYTRTYESAGEKWLVVGRADHKAGQDDPEVDYYEELEKYVAERFPVASFGHRWSSQYYEPTDGLPYIGKTPGGSTLMATGYSGDGLVYGTIAGLLLADRITGKINPWADAYRAHRMPSLNSAKTYIEENIDVPKHLIAERIKSHPDASKLQPGTGAIATIEGHRYAVYKNDDGELTAVSATCPHLGCLVKWNAMEKTWDCPCHGSRFTCQGDILIGPATKGLQSS